MAENNLENMDIANMTRQEIEKLLRDLTMNMPQEVQEEVATNQGADETTTQKEPLQGQVQNNDGGYSYEIDNLTQLKRYLILGSSNSYRSQKPDVLSTIPVVHDMIEADEGSVVIDTVLEFNRDARISREEHFLIVLRDCIMYKGDEKKYYDKEKKITIQRAAYDSIVEVCNIPTKLFRFLDLCNPFFEKEWKPSMDEIKTKTQIKKRKRAEEKELANQHAQKMATESCEVVEEVQTGEPLKKKKKKKKKTTKKKKVSSDPSKKYKRSSSWGRARKRGIASFYQDGKKDANRLLLLLTKYKSRHNWNHKQVLGYCHPKITGDEATAKNIVLQYCTKGFDAIKKNYSDGSSILDSKTNKVLDHIKILEDIKSLSPEKEEDIDKLLDTLKKYGQRDALEEFTSAYAVPGCDSPVKKNPDNKKCSFQLTREHLPTAFLKIKKV